MITWFLIIIPIIFISIRLIFIFLVMRYGKISYDGFSAFGFAYNHQKAIFYSTRNAWQKNFGYTHLYDVLSPLFMMIMDTEPIRFYYNNKHWLITFWKGQYGIVTGAEVGIYCTSQPHVNKKTVYLPVSDSEMLNINLILYKKDQIIAKVNAKHWWLAIFKLGMFSNPKDLTMDINITFPNHEMLTAFLKSFKKLGYNDKHYVTINNIFCFRYTKPRTRKVWTRSWLTDAVRQFINRQNVKLYNDYLGDLIDNNQRDDSQSNNNSFINIQNLIPAFLKNSPDKHQGSSSYSQENLSTSASNFVFLEHDLPTKPKEST